MLGFKYENLNKIQGEERTPTSHSQKFKNSDDKHAQRVYAGYIGCSGIPLGDDQKYSK